MLGQMSGSGRALVVGGLLLLAAPVLFLGFVTVAIASDNSADVPMVLLFAGSLLTGLAGRRFVLVVAGIVVVYVLPRRRSADAVAGDWSPPSASGLRTRRPTGNPPAAVTSCSWSPARSTNAYNVYCVDPVRARLVLNPAVITRLLDNPGLDLVLENGLLRLDRPRAFAAESTAEAMVDLAYSVHRSASAAQVRAR